MSIDGACKTGKEGRGVVGRWKEAGTERGPGKSDSYTLRPQRSLTSVVQTIFLHV